MFILEALEARHGDSLLLRYGTAAKPGLLVIDGGPKGTYARTLKKRLAELRKGKAALPIDMVMVSHLDDDHIAGIVDMLREMRDAEDEGTPVPYKIGRLWVNTYEDKLGPGETAALRALAKQVDLEKRFPRAHKVSVAQGRELRDLARRFGLAQNRPFKGLVRSPDAGKKTIKLGGLSLTVVAPNETRLDQLKTEWAEKVRALKNKKITPAQAAAYVDKSVFNLSSIVVLAEVGSKSMLLTGDARGDHTLEGLTSAKLTDKKGVIEVDVLKLPHHGSEHNVDEDYFKRIRAKHYVISADGEYGNPDSPTLAMLSKARRGERFTIWLTNHAGKAGKGLAKRLDKFFADDKSRKYDVEYRAENALSLSVEL